MKSLINLNTTTAYHLLHGGTLALARAERAGIRVDLDYIKSKKNHLSRRIERMEQQFASTKFFSEWQRSCKSKVNIYSNQQLSNFLYSTKKLKPTKTIVLSIKIDLSFSFEGVSPSYISL
jgi:DNA polymerase I-like protein with 3'-5' exonuclease and polymerase domains